MWPKDGSFYKKCLECIFDCDIFSELPKKEYIPGLWFYLCLNVLIYLCILFLSIVFFWGLQFSFHILFCFFVICLGPWFFLLVIKHSFEGDRVNSILSEKESWTKVSKFRNQQFKNSDLFFVSSPQKSDSNSVWACKNGIHFNWLPCFPSKITLGYNFEIQCISSYKTLLQIIPAF